ncbi:hypothetical protein BJV82DRAFT_138562 [Fennellomyces sp. T-0311]|nr:hypothetical protein BJV82DRAFT_138562 [Fennellomyces sp. T-0311]
MQSMDTPVQVDWLKQQPHNKRQSTFLAHNKYSTVMNTKTFPASLQDQSSNMINRGWNYSPDHQRALTPSPTPSASSISSTSGPSLSLPKKASAIGLNGQFLPQLNLEPLMLHPQDDEDEEDHERIDGDAHRRIRLLENQLARAQKETQTYREQLAHHDQTTQQMLTDSLAEKEKQSAQIRQLLNVVAKQEQLIQLLQERNTPEDGDYVAMRIQLHTMRQELDAIVGEKRSLEMRMASFLEEELDELTMSHEDLGTLSDHQNDEILHHLEMRRRSSSVLDADQYSLMAFGSPTKTINSNTLLPPLNQVDEEDGDDDEDAVSRYSSFASSPMTATTSFRDSGIRQSLSSMGTNSPTTAAANNAARKAAWQKVMLPPATPPPSHPLPPVPPLGVMAATNNIDAKQQEYSMPEEELPLPPTEHALQAGAHPLPPVPSPSRSHRSLSPQRLSMHPLVISTSRTGKHTSADAINKQNNQHRSLSPPPPSAPPIVSTQSSSLLAALNKNSSVDTDISVATGMAEGSDGRDRGGFWKGMRKKWKK